MTEPARKLTSKILRTLRKRRGWTEDQLADHLGIPGLGTLIARWEEQDLPIGEPMAGLLRRTLDSEPSDSGDASGLSGEADMIWRRSGNWYQTWRQVSVLPLAPIQIDAQAFAKLFPGAALPHEQHVHGFPFVEYSLPREVYKLDGDRWRGVIPIDEYPPAYLWLLQRDGAFLYREKIWEDDKSSITEGHLHVGSILEICASVVFFVQRLTQWVTLPRRYRVVLELAGMRERGVVSQLEGTPSDMIRVGPPQHLGTQDRYSASLDVDLDRLTTYPVGVVYDLVGEALQSLRPDLAVRDQLERQLRLRHASDDRRGQIRFLGFLDQVLAGRPARRAVVSMDARRVGMLVETPGGTRFTYDAQYVKRPDARALSPKMPVRKEPYEATQLLPFFENLLPEGAQRELLVRHRKLREHDDFGVLLATLPAAIGNVEIHQEE